MITNELITEFYKTFETQPINTEIQNLLTHFYTYRRVTPEIEALFTLLHRYAPKQFQYKGKIYRGIKCYLNESLNIDSTETVCWTANESRAMGYAQPVDCREELTNSYILKQETETALNLTKLVKSILNQCNNGLVQCFQESQEPTIYIDTAHNFSLKTYRNNKNNILTHTGGNQLLSVGVHTCYGKPVPNCHKSNITLYVEEELLSPLKRFMGYLNKFTEEYQGNFYIRENYYPIETIKASSAYKKGRKYYDADQSDSLTLCYIRENNKYIITHLNHYYEPYGIEYKKDQLSIRYITLPIKEWDCIARQDLLHNLFDYLETSINHKSYYGLGIEDTKKFISHFYQCIECHNLLIRKLIVKTPLKCDERFIQFESEEQLKQYEKCLAYFNKEYKETDLTLQPCNPCYATTPTHFALSFTADQLKLASMEFNLFIGEDTQASPPYAEYSNHIVELFTILLTVEDWYTVIKNDLVKHLLLTVESISYDGEKLARFNNVYFLKELYKILRNRE